MIKGFLTLFTLTLLVSFSFADINGVWTYSEDIRPGEFGRDEGDNSTPYVFNNDVIFNQKIKIGNDTILVNYGDTYVVTNEIDNSTTIINDDEVFETIVEDGRVTIVNNIENLTTVYEGNTISTITQKNITRIFDYSDRSTTIIDQSTGDTQIIMHDSYWESTESGLGYNNGNVGIGYTDPSSKLSVNGDISGSLFRDINNLDYYLNPSSKSNFLNLEVVGTMHANRYNDLDDSSYFVDADKLSKLNSIISYKYYSIESETNDLNYDFYMDPVDKSVVNNIDVEGTLNVKGQNIEDFVTSGIPTCMGKNKALGWDGSNWICNDVESTVTTITVTTSCYHPSNIGTIGQSDDCYGMLIVDNSMLRTAKNINDGSDKAIEFEGVEYTFGDSDKNIFTGQVTNMSRVGFSTKFNEDIEYWDTRRVIDMSKMFYKARLFNQDISSWDVSNVKSMEKMFYDAEEFNQDISSWDVSNVENMEDMFYYTKKFNRNLNNWDVSSVKNMHGMFGKSVYNQPMSSWDVSNVEDMSYMFVEVENFNQPLNSWNVAKVKNMRGMFRKTNFNQPLSSWDVSNVENMANMFQLTPFNQNINNWDVSSVTNMESMFAHGWAFTSSGNIYFPAKFNKPLNNWDVSSVINMKGMFATSNFNQPLNNWDVSSVTNMQSMFVNAKKYNQNLRSWDVDQVTKCTNFRASGKLSSGNAPNFTNC